MNPADPLAATIDRAQELLDRAGLRGVLIGGVSVVAWTQPRLTRDVDLVVELLPEHVDRLLAACTAVGYLWDDEEVALLSEGGFMRLVPADPELALLPIGVLLDDTDLHRQVLERALAVELGGRAVRLATAEDTMLLKLVAFRPQDTLDLEAFVEHLRDRLDLDYLRGWADRLRVRGRLECYLQGDAVE